MAEIIQVPGRVRGQDVEDQADELAAATARLAELLTAFTNEPRRSLDAIAVFRGRSRWRTRRPSCAPRSGSTSMTRRTRRPRPHGPEPLEGLRSASGTFKWVADGWI